MGFFTSSKSWGNVTVQKGKTADYQAGKWAKAKHAKAHADKHNNPSKFKQGKQGKK